VLEVEAVDDEDAEEAAPELPVLEAADEAEGAEGAEEEVALPEASVDCAAVELLSAPAPSAPAAELSEPLSLFCASPGAPLA
jgi:hypothetical protein